MEPNMPAGIAPAPALTIKPTTTAKAAPDMHRVKRMYFIYGVGVTAIVAATMMLIMFLVLQANGANIMPDPYLPPVTGNGSQSSTSTSVTSSESSSATSSLTSSSLTSSSSITSTPTSSKSSSTSATSTTISTTVTSSTSSAATN